MGGQPRGLARRLLSRHAPIGGHGAPICWYWRSDADGVATWGPTSRPTTVGPPPGAPLQPDRHRLTTTNTSFNKINTRPFHDQGQPPRPAG